MVHDRTAGRISERGVSLLELMIYLAVMAILGIPLAMVTVTVSRSAAEGDMLSKILERNRSTLQRIVGEYRESLQGTTSVLNGGKTLRFTSNGGFNGAAPVAGPIIRYEVRLSPTETVNGVDDDRNGLADESILVRVDQSTAQEVVITGGLNTALSSFAVNGNGVTVNVTTSGRVNGASGVTDAQRSITVFPRN
jgi:type II secretory pathway pseudopilin PulG